MTLLAPKIDAAIKQILDVFDDFHPYDQKFLVKRLKENPKFEALMSPADEIERLRSRGERLEGALTTAYQFCDGWNFEPGEQATEAEAVRDEISQAMPELDPPPQLRDTEIG
jgi:hypothetical protein